MRDLRDPTWLAQGAGAPLSGNASPARASTGRQRLSPGSLDALARLDSPVYAWSDGSALELCASPDGGERSLLGWAPSLRPESLGDREFLAAHGLRYPYVAGAMAGGIGSEELVIALARAGMLGGFGAGGLDLPRIEQAIATIQRSLPGQENYEINLLHNPVHPPQELATVELLLRTGVPRVSASAFLGLTLPVVYYRAKGLSRGPDGAPVARTHLLAKLSRPEVASEFMQPAPEPLLRQLVADGRITREQAELAARVPVAQDITIEADSGGHTDNQAFVPLLSSICELRDRIVSERGYAQNIRVGAGGGISTPASVAAAFAAGAAYVLTGSINQSCREAATSDLVKQMLCEVDIGGVTMAPAADMFEMGVRVQVLKHKTLFAARAKKLFDLFRAYGSWEELPAAERKQIEERFFRRPFADVSREVEAYLSSRDPARVEKVRGDPKARMGYAFKWYLHMSSRWAIDGVADRAVDFQVWCGPAMAAFNHWVKGSFLEPPAERRVVVVARNLLHGAAVLLRARILAMQGVPLPQEAFRFQPQPL